MAVLTKEDVHRLRNGCVNARQCYVKCDMSALQALGLCCAGWAVSARLCAVCMHPATLAAIAPRFIRTSP